MAPHRLSGGLRSSVKPGTGSGIVVNRKLRIVVSSAIFRILCKYIGHTIAVLAGLTALMAIRDILVYPDTRLRRISRVVTEFDQTLKDLVTDMTDTMYAAPGIGLAAVQIDVPMRVIVMDLSRERNQLRVFINPEITDLDQGVTEIEEGCLSVPGIYSSVTRAQSVRVDACDINGNPFQVEGDVLLSVCIQHEVDHLNGKVFVDYLSRLKQARVREKLKKEARQSAPVTL